MQTTKPFLNRLISKCRETRGQSVLEFALVLPILLLLVLGTVEIGWLMNVHLAAANAAREGARAAAVGKTTSAIDTRVNAALPSYITATITKEKSSTGVSNSFTALGDGTTYNNAANGDFVRVTITITHKQLTNFLPGLTGMTITKSVTMRRELT